MIKINTQNKLIICILIIIASIVVGISSITISAYRRDAISNLFNNNEANLTQAIQRFEEVQNLIRSTARTLYINSDIKLARYSTELSYFNEYEIKKEFTNIIGCNPQISSIYLINNKADFVIDSLGTASFIEEFYDPQIIQLLKEEESMGNEFKIRGTVFDYLAKVYDHTYLTYIYSESITPLGIDDAVVVNVELSNIIDIIYPTTSTEETSFMIFDNKGNVVVSSNENPQDSQEIYKEVWKDSQEKTTYNQIKEIDGRKQLISFKKSSDGHWSYMISNDYKSLFEQIKGILGTLILFNIFLLMAAGTIIGIIVKKTFNPLTTCIANIENKYNDIMDNKEKLKITDIEYLVSSLENMMHQTKNLQKQNITIMKDINRQNLKAILRGQDINKDKNIQHMIETEYLSDSNYMILLMLHRQALTSEKDRDWQLYALSNIVEELWYPVPIKLYKIDKDKIVILVEKTDEDIEHVVKEIHKKINENTLKYFKFDVLTTYTANKISVYDLDKTYTSLNEALNNNYYKGVDNILSLEAYEAFNNTLSNKYPYIKSRNVVEAINAGNIEQFIRCNTEFFEEMKKINVSFLNMYTMNYTNTIIKALNNKLGYNSVEIDQFLTPENERKQLDDRRELFQKVVVDRLEEFLNKTDQEEDRQLKYVNFAKEMIEQEYNNINLSADFIAKELHLSSSYLRNLFREKLNISIGSYINEIRCERAKELLVGTQLSGMEISLKVGFSNQQYFFTLFKKYTGYTPKQYRENYRN